MIGTLFILAAGRAPGWLDFNLAGYTDHPAVRRSSVGVFDQDKGYYLVREYECDGGCVTMVLTRDRKTVAGFGYRVPSLPATEGATKPLKQERLRHLSTGKGIEIGDPEERVRKLLGAPSKARHPEGFPECDEWVYEWQESHGKDENPTEHVNAYTFRAGKLIEVTFSHSSC